MFREKQYVYNEETLSYEIVSMSFGRILLRVLLVLLTGFVCFVIYAYIFVHVLGFRPPKTLIMENRNRDLLARMEVMDQHVDDEDAALTELQMRDNIVYRPVFGMEEISAQTRDAGFVGESRYLFLNQYENAPKLIASARRLDAVSKKAVIQSKSFDEVELLAGRAGDMATCIPSINPVDIGKRVHLTSPFGYRLHPIKGVMLLHSGIDLAGPAGEPIYAAGSGIIESVQIGFFGYGNIVVIDPGFGYKTKYAHVKDIFVAEGQKVFRGDQIATIGKTGTATGPHLHYEVIYKGNAVNPWSYINSDMTSAEYRQIVTPASEKDGSKRKKR